MQVNLHHFDKSKRSIDKVLESYTLLATFIGMQWYIVLFAIILGKQFQNCNKQI